MSISLTQDIGSQNSRLRAVAAIAGCVCLIMQVSAQAQVRHVDWGDRLDALTSDVPGLVIVDRDFDGADGYGKPNRIQAVRGLSRFYGTVLLLDAVEVSPVLVEERTWVWTRVKARVAEVLRSSDNAPAVGSVAEFNIPVGETMMGAVTIRAGYKPRVEAQHQYVAFVQTKSPVNPSLMFAVESRRLAQTWPRDPSWAGFRRQNYFATAKPLLGMTLQSFKKALEDSK